MRAVGNVFQTWTDSISLGKSSTAKQDRPELPVSPLFDPVRSLSAIYLHVLLTPLHFKETFYNIFTAVYSSVC